MGRRPSNCHCNYSILYCMLCRTLWMCMSNSQKSKQSKKVILRRNTRHCIRNLSQKATYQLMDCMISRLKASQNHMCYICTHSLNKYTSMSAEIKFSLKREFSLVVVLRCLLSGEGKASILIKQEEDTTMKMNLCITLFSSQR